MPAWGRLVVRGPAAWRLLSDRREALCRPDAGHRGLLDAIAVGGAVVSQWPPGTRLARPRYLLRSRTVAALGSGTVVIGAGARSGTMTAARHAGEPGRPLTAIPGPVTSAMPAACHELIRELSAVCVASAADTPGRAPV